ncbi:S1/P1 nuclease [Roseateles sp. DC23W]|uniref:S1/P1 nuclease n=1 Tax=Pelomonas dachongensis TaxID=3299029 RepID=A0ABW7EUD7_9BURK
MVIYLVGDVHEPLHVGLASDKGGNLYQLRAFGRGSNLHAVWDGELIRRSAGGLSQKLHDASTVSASGSRTADLARWANESCTVRSAAGFFPDDRMAGPESDFLAAAMVGKSLEEALEDVQTTEGSVSEDMRSVIDDVLQCGQAYEFKADEDSVRDAV